jgi:outer membrane protein OmpA-like peptidoglycan-associated protein
MKLFRLKLLCILVFVSLKTFGQKLDKANDLYRKGYYAMAIEEYKGVLKKKPNPIAKSNMANCYRILNQAQNAADVYASIVAEKKEEPKDIFNYGDVMMMLGKYDSARYFFKRYTELSPDDPRGEQQLKACDNFSKIKPIFQNIVLEPYEYNTEADETAPCFFQNKFLFASDRSQGFKMMKESNKTTGREYITVWSSDTLGSGVYAEPVSYSGKLNNVNQNTGNASFSANGKAVYFCRNSDIPDRKGSFNMQLFSAESNDGGKSWHDVEKLSFCSKDFNYLYPSVSPDGKMLFFVTDKGGGFGGLDIYVTKKTKKGWTKPENLGQNVNTPAHEGFPHYAFDSKLFFCSKGHSGYGGFDIYMTELDTAMGEWKKPINMGTPFNTAYDDISIFFKDSTSGAFSSPRGGRGDDIFFFKMTNQTLFDTKLTFYANQESNASDAQLAEDVFLSNSTQPLDLFAYALGNKEELKKGKKFTFDSFVFDGESVDISLETAEELDKLSDILSMHRKVAFEIGYHTEGGLTDAKNIAQKRAEAMIVYLVKKGINAKRLIAKGYGDMFPLKNCQTDNCSPEEIQKNKRVEIKIKDVL